MHITAAVLGTVLVLLVGGADVRLAVRRRGDDRKAVLGRHVGAHLTIVDRRRTVPGPLTGLVRGVNRQHVRVRTTGAEVRVPISAISEIWDGRRLLHRW
ncbi:MAG: hypothetical protein QOD63_1947 [Actinomycetota bacterium]|nr:hypothetical protein [Actinomycetota bacterium]